MVNKHKSKGMNIIKVLIALIFVLLIGGFGYFAFTDVPIQQQEVVKEIQNERFFKE